MAQVQRASLADQAAQLLMERIRAGEWALGAKLPGETTLAPQLGVGRSTLREAIRQLAGQGVVTSRQGSGVVITALDVRDEWDAVLRRADIVAVLEARIAIESEAARLAAERRTPAELRGIRRALDTRAAAYELAGTLVDADTAFHRLIVVAAHNHLLTELFDSMVPRVRQAMIEMLRISPGRDAGADLRSHADLVDAIADRDQTQAAGRSREHLSALKAAIGGTKLRSGRS
jgi:DNA-binding FadR family transcriptional regulator